MASEFFVWNAAGLDMTVGDPIAVFLAEGTKVSLTTSKQRVVDQWRPYFEIGEDWLVHAKSKTPLSSLFAQSTYISGDFSPYNDDTADKYKAALRAAGGKTVVFTREKA
jgi:hypothetical protein